MTERWISVLGEGEATVAPDVAVVSLSASAKGQDLAPTRDDVNARMSSVLARLRELGIADADLQAADVQIHPEYDYRRDGQKLVGYLVSRSVTVSVRSIDRLGDVVSAVSEAGTNEVHGVRMAASDPSAAEHEALAAAVAAARAGAEAIATAAAVTLGEMIRVEEADRLDWPQPRMPMGAMAASADVSTEVAVGDLTVRRSVRAWFAIGD